MTIKELKEVIGNASDEAEVMINSIYDCNTNDLKPSECSEVHYDHNKNCIFITPLILAGR